MENEKQKKEKLIKALSFILDQETEKPLDEMDGDLITACTEFLLDLQNKDVTLSTEEIEERVKTIPFVEKTDINRDQARTKTTVKKLLLIAAIVSVLFTILSLSTTSSDWNMFDALYQKYERISQVPTDIEFYENGVTYGVDGPAKVYSSFEEWQENEVNDILLPKKFPESFTFRSIMVATEDGCEETIFSFRNGTTSYTVKKNSTVSQGVLDNATPITIGSTAVYIEDLQNVNLYQVHFSYNGDYYEIVHSDKEPVHKILEDLKPYL